MGGVAVRDGKICIDGKPFRVISGALHYFRVHPELWDDRLDKAAAFGLNTIETYVPWNLHEPHPGEFRFSGGVDLESFMEKVAARGFKMILRPGPYICSEWDNGGLPGWLMAVPGVEIRRMNGPYLERVTGYFDVLLEKIRPFIYTNGGPVIMIQIENEYGSYCHDHEYLCFIRDLYRRHHLDVPYFTSDGDASHFILGGSLPDELMTLNFGSNSERAFRNGRRFRPEGPDFCMEFWDGWFDHWGEIHHVRGDDCSQEADRILGSGGNMNFYMFHGGTNFGFTNGANDTLEGDYLPVVTSYDYDSPLSECGDPTAKFTSCQEVIRKHTGNPRIRPVAPSRKICPGAVKFTSSARVLDNLEALRSVSGRSATPVTMEQAGESFGFIHYTTRLDGPMFSAEATGTTETLRLFQVNDFAQVWLDGRYLGSRWRETGVNGFDLPEIPAEGARLDILVENCGRINYGPRVGRDFKGITGGVAVEHQLRLGWEYNALPMENIGGLAFHGFADAPATFHRGEFTVDGIGEAFLKRPGRKGLVWINGFNLGRYWEKGPTQTLYVPSPVLKKGRNEIVVLELEALDSDGAEFAPAPVLG